MKKIYKTDVRAFYNPDCGKYGVEAIVKAESINDKQYYKWTQVEIPGKDIVYTKYAGVAKRWADEMRCRGVLEVRADMIDQPGRDERAVY